MVDRSQCPQWVNNMTKTFAPGTLKPKDLKKGDVIGGVWTVTEIYNNGDVMTDWNFFSLVSITAILSKFEVTREVEVKTKVVALGEVNVLGSSPLVFSVDRKSIDYWAKSYDLKDGDIITVTREVEL